MSAKTILEKANFPTVCKNYHFYQAIIKVFLVPCVVLDSRLIVSLNKIMLLTLFPSKNKDFGFLKANIRRILYFVPEETMIECYSTCPEEGLSKYDTK